MVFMARTQTSTAANPLLTFIYQDPDTAVLKDVSALSYTVMDVTTPAKEITPTVKVAETAVNLVTNRLSLGRYYAPLAVADSWTLGDYQVVWTYQYAGGTEQTMTTPLHVTAETHGPPLYYATVQDVYDSGLSTDSYSIAVVRKALAKATALLERWTGRVFRAEYRTVRVDGGGGMKLRFREPIIAVEALEISDEFTQDYLVSTADREVFIYNRHIRLGQLSPDDRRNPRIEYSYGLRPLGANGYFSDGSQEVKVTGIFGYTEPDGSPLGGTPLEVRDLTVKVALLHVDGAATNAGWDAKNKWKVVEERTREQTIKYGGAGASTGGLVAPGSTSFFTGDEEIDSAILRLRVGPAMRGG
jgi:hypothetical protein